MLLLLFFMTVLWGFFCKTHTVQNDRIIAPYLRQNDKFHAKIVKIVGVAVS